MKTSENASLSKLKVMSTSNRALKIAQILLTQSLDEDDRVEEKKVSNILEELRLNPPLQHLEILKRYAFLVKRHLTTYQSILEYRGGNGLEIAKRISNKDFIKDKNTEIKPAESSSLIAGFRLKVGDDVYEDSVANRLNNLRKVLLQQS